MQICFRNTDKIPTGKEYENYAEAPSDNEPWFELLHFDGMQQLNDARLLACLNRDGAVLLLSGNGFPRERAESIESQFSGQRLHCLRIPYGQADPPTSFLNLLKVVEKLERVSTETPVPWSTLYPAPSDVLEKLRRTQPATASYQQEFEGLWRLQEPEPVTVIVWDGMPSQPGDGGPNLLPYLTPLDWAAATCLKHPEARWTFFLVDCASKSFPSPSLRLYERLPGLFPHVRFYESHEAARLLADIEGCPQSPPPPVAWLRRLWQSLLTDPIEKRDRHSISNLVGLHVLLAAMGKPGQTGPLEALLNAAGLVDEATREAPSLPWFDAPDCVDQFILIDDMASLGWTEFLKLALATDKVVPFSKVEDLNLPGRIEAAFSSGQPLSLGGNDREIVFLDLRLFGMRPNSGRSEEKIFLRQLLEIARKRDLFRGDYEAIESYLDGVEDETPEYHVALTLLPRLLAEADPLLPIVLFSSTGQKIIYDKLRQYKSSIVVDFDKPRFFTNTSDSIVVDTHRRFVRSLEAAVPIARGRNVCLAFPHVATPPSHEGEVVEIYIDESADRDGRTFVVGGVVLTYPFNTDVEKLDRKLTGGLVWGLAEGHPPADVDDSFPDRPGDYLDKEPSLQAANYEPHLSRIAGLAESLGISIRAFALTEQVRSGSHPSELLDPGSIDNLYRLMLCESLETVLFDLACSRSEIRVDVATRVFYVKGEGALERCVRLHDLWGIGYRREKPESFRCFSLSASEVYPMVSQVLSLRPQALAVERARGVSLVDFGDLAKWRADPKQYDRFSRAVTQAAEFRGPRPRQIHYLADCVARLARFYATGYTLPPTAATWFKNGFLQGRNKAFPFWLQASRTASPSRLPKELQSPEHLHLAEALKIAYDALQTEPEARDYSFSRWVRPQASRWTKDLISCGQFSALCDLL